MLAIARHEFLIFGFMAVGSLSSGALLSSFGWAAVNALALPVVLGAALLLAGPTSVRRAQTV